MRNMLIAAALASVAGPALAAAPVSVPSLVERVDIPYEQFTLANGLRVVVHTDRKAPVVAVSVWYGVGSADEPKGKTGFAHLFEHLMFNGSGGYDGEFFEPLEDVGATNYNGTTDFDRTNYFQNVPTPALDLALFLEADRMGNLLPAVTEAKLVNQRGVVQNEKRQSDNNPYGLVFYSLLQGMFPEGHPYRHSPIGSMTDLDAASLGDVQQWFKTHYGPNNAVLVLAGDVDAATARAKVERYFGAIPRGPATANMKAPVPGSATITRATMKDRVANARLYIAWPGPTAIDPAYAQLDIATTILAGGASSRLYNDLVRDKQLAVSVGGFSLDQELAGATILTVDVKEGVDPAVVEARVDALVAEFLRTGPTADEVTRVATRQVAGTIRGLEQVGGFGGKAVALAEGTLYANDPGYYKTELTRYATATPATVSAAARRWIGRGGFRLAVTPGERGPAELALVGATGKQAPDATTPAGAREADRSRLPTVQRSDALDFPAVERGRLRNGVEVVFAQRTAVPVIEIMASFDAGNAADPRDKLGTQSLMLSLLDEGTATRTGPQIIEEGERLGAQIGVSAGQDRTRATLSALVPNLAPSLALFADVLRNPRFAPAEVERVRGIQLAGIAQEESDPTGIAGRALPAIIYGRDHPYAVPGSGLGTREGVARITRDDLVRFHQSWVRPDTMQLFVVGDTTLAAILPELDRALGDWRPAAVAKGVKRFPAAAQAGRPRIVLIDRPNSPQSYIAAGYPLGIKGTDDPLELRTANDILGGTFTSRLNTDLRETKGWAYGVGSGVSGVREQVAFTLRAPVQADKTGASIVALREGIAAYTGARPTTAGELGRIVNSNVLSLPGDFETGGAVLAALESNALLGRSDDYYEKLPPRYRALTTASLGTAARGVIDPGKLSWVIVGDAATVKPQLDTVGLPVEVISATAVK